MLRDGEVLVVHRQRYDDWTLPKGKLEPGETWEQAALREVREETGVECALGRALGSTHYAVSGRAKEVRWFEMTPLVLSDERDGEVDDQRWLPMDAAIALLTYEHDRTLLRDLRPA